MKTAVRILSLTLAFMMTVAFCSCGYKPSTPTKTDTTNSESASTPDLTVTNTVDITFKGMGDVRVELYGKEAPITVENFMKLVNDKFYDGLTIHRNVPGFVIQGGDPLGNGTGGSKDTIKGEFLSNGVDNYITHERGVISMARSSLPDSASSQFFIVLSDSAKTSLDGQYAAFGKVVSGMDIVDKIAQIEVADRSSGFIAKENQPIIESIREVK